MRRFFHLKPVKSSSRNSTYNASQASSCRKDGVIAPQSRDRLSPCADGTASRGRSRGVAGREEGETPTEEVQFLQKLLGFYSGEVPTPYNEGKGKLPAEARTPRPALPPAKDTATRGGRLRTACTETPLPPLRGHRLSPAPFPAPRRAGFGHICPSPPGTTLCGGLGTAVPSRLAGRDRCDRPAPRGGRSLPVCTRGRPGARTYLPARPPAARAHRRPPHPPPALRPHVTAGGQSPGAGRGGGREGGTATPLPAFPARALAPYLPQPGGGDGAGSAPPLPRAPPLPPDRRPHPSPFPRLPLGGGR